MSQKINAVVEAVTGVTLTPLARVVRTIIQTVLAFAVAEPVLIKLVSVNAGTATKAASITAGLVFVVSTVQNVLEHFGVLPVTGGKTVSGS
jgi:hypothetical protein